MGDTRRAGHAADADLEMAKARLVTLFLHPRRQIGKINAGRDHKIGALGGEIDARVEHARRGFQRLFDMGNTGGAGHAADPHGQSFSGGGLARRRRGAIQFGFYGHA